MVVRSPSRLSFAQTKNARRPFLIITTKLSANVWKLDERKMGYSVTYIGFLFKVQMDRKRGARIGSSLK